MHNMLGLYYRKVYHVTTDVKSCVWFYRNSLRHLQYLFLSLGCIDWFCTANTAKLNEIIFTLLYPDWSKHRHPRSLIPRRVLDKAINFHPKYYPEKVISTFYLENIGDEDFLLYLSKHTLYFRIYHTYMHTHTYYIWNFIKDTIFNIF